MMAAQIEVNASPPSNETGYRSFKLGEFGAEAVNVEFESPIDEDDAREALRAQPGITLIDRRTDEGYVTPAECVGEDPVFVSRLRTDPTVDHGLSMWVVADNLRKGAALNAVQIAECLVEDYLN